MLILLLTTFNRGFMTERKGSHVIYVGDSIVDLILCTGRFPSSFVSETESANSYLQTPKRWMSGAKA